MKLKTFFIGSAKPIVILILFNIGIIFNIPNLFSFTEHTTIYLSQLVFFHMTINLLIGTVTVFALFFSFAPLIYSRQYIPSHIYPRYLLPHESTIQYWGNLFGVSIIYVYFSLFDKITLNNKILLILLIIYAVVQSVRYFIWIIKIIIPEELFKMILEKLSLDTIDEDEKDLEDKNLNLQNNIGKSDGFIIPKQHEIYDLFVEDNFDIITKTKGVVIDIDTANIIKILEPFGPFIKKFELKVWIGSSIPDYKSGQEITVTTLARILFQPNKDEEYPINKILNDINKISNELKQCFKIDKKRKTFWDHRVILDDALSVYQKGLDTDPYVIKQYFLEISKYIYRDYEKDESISWESENGSKQQIYRYLIENIFLKTKSQLTGTNVQLILALLYEVNYNGVKFKSVPLRLSILSVFNHMFSSIIYSGITNHEKLSTIGLYIKELVFNSHVKESFRNNEINWDEQIQPIIRTGVDIAISLYGLLIKYSYRYNEKDTFDHLKINGQFIIDLLQPLFHYKDEYSSNEEDLVEFNKKVKNEIDYLAQNLVHLAIIIYMRVGRRELPKNFIQQIAFPLVDHCNNLGKYYGITSDVLLLDMFYSHEFAVPYSSVLDSYFLINPIHEAGSYSPRYYSFESFWFSYSVYRKKNNKSYIPFDLPSKNIDYSIGLLKQYLKRINDGIVKNFYSTSKELNVEIIEDYKNSLIKLIESVS